MWQRRNMHRTGQNGRRQMADIRAEIKNFKEAVYGEDVRGSMISLAEKVNAETEKTTKLAQDTSEKVDGFKQKIEDNKSAVEQLRNDHNDDIASLTQNKADAIINTASGEHIVVGDSSGHLLDNLKIYGKSIQNGEPTPDNPVPIVSTGDKGKIDIGIHGKQLFDASKIHTKSQGGATVTNNGDGSFTISGSGTLSTTFDITINYSHEYSVGLIKKGAIHNNFRNNETEPHVYAQIYYNGNFYNFMHIYNITDEMLNYSDMRLLIGFYGDKGTTIKPGTIRPMLYQDGDGTWEPFQPLQSLSIPTSNGLPGIPVESGGNYTDQNGQQWICDEIDLKRGKYVKRVGKKQFDGSEDEKWRLAPSLGVNRFIISIPGSYYIPNEHTEVICNRGRYKKGQPFEVSQIYMWDSTFYYTPDQILSDVLSFKKWLNTNPLDVVYRLSTPTETNIPPEVLEAYKALHSNYPSTVVQNDSGAGMELSYVADPKNYIDKKLKEFVTVNMQNTANLLSLMPDNVQAAMIENDTNNILESEVSQ